MVMKGIIRQILNNDGKTLISEGIDVLHTGKKAVVFQLNREEFIKVRDLLKTVGDDKTEFKIDISGIEFIKGYNPVIKYDYRGCGVLEEFNHPSMYATLKPKLDIQEKINAKITELESGNNGFVAIHVRRTDHIGHAVANKLFTTDADFFAFLDKQSPAANIYLATDNQGTQKIFKSRYGERLKAMKWIIPRLALRQTDLEDAIVDIFTCANAPEFLGSGYSSFSDLINDLRDTRYCWGKMYK